MFRRKTIRDKISREVNLWLDLGEYTETIDGALAGLGALALSVGEYKLAEEINLARYKRRKLW